MSNILTLYKEMEKVCVALDNEHDQALRDRQEWQAKLNELKAKFSRDIDALAEEISGSCVQRAQRITDTIGQQTLQAAE